MLRILLVKLGAMVRRRRIDAELDEEIETHLAMATEEYMRQGMTREKARRAAMKSFGGMDQMRERHREARGVPWVEELGRDLGLSARTLRRERGFALTVVSTLAIGIGANAAIVSVVDAVLLRPLPYPDSERVVTVGFLRDGGRAAARLSAPGYQFFQEENRSFQGLGAHYSVTMPLIGSGEPMQASVAAMTNSAFAALSVPPWLGRLPAGDEDLPGGRRVVVLSHDLWSTRFESDPQVVGRTIELNDTTREVIGVMPEDFAFPSRAIDVWVPMRMNLSDTGIRFFPYHLIGRLRSDATLESASADIDRLIQRLPEVGHNEASLGSIMSGVVSVMTLKEDLVGRSRDLLVVLMGAVSLVLLVALSNVATLFIVRGEERAQQRAVRAALGASRQRLVRHALGEALLLTLTGGLVGLVLAFAGTRVLISLAPPSIPRLDGASMTRVVLGYAVAISAGAGFIFALLSGAGARSGRHSLTGLSGAGRNATVGAERLRVRGVLVAAQVAFAVVLLIGSGLMVRSYARLRSVDPGFDAANITKFGLVLPATRYSNQGASALYLRLVERLQSLPGVEAAGVTTGLPVTPLQASYRMNIEDVPDGTDVFVIRWITPGYFETMGIPVLSGRTMLPDDVDEFRLFISASLADRYWSAASAIGRRMGPGFSWAEIVGVVGDDRIRGLDVPVESGAYAPMGAPGSPSVLSVSVVVRAGDDRGDLVPLLRREVRMLDPELPLIDIATMDEVISGSYAVSRTSFTLLLLGTSAVVALILGAVGIYGVIAYSVSRRTRELGIRIALGATPRTIVARVASAGVVPAAIGVVTGLGVAAWSSRALASLLFETERLDPASFLVGPSVLLLVAVVACIVPVRQAITVDPVRALRSE